MLIRIRAQLGHADIRWCPKAQVGENIHPCYTVQLAPHHIEQPKKARRGVGRRPCGRANEECRLILVVRTRRYGRARPSPGRWRTHRSVLDARHRSAELCCAAAANPTPPALRVLRPLVEQHRRLRNGLSQGWTKSRRAFRLRLATGSRGPSVVSKMCKYCYATAGLRTEPVSCNGVEIVGRPCTRLHRRTPRLARHTRAHRPRRRTVGDIRPGRLRIGPRRAPSGTGRAIDVVRLFGVLCY